MNSKRKSLFLLFLGVVVGCLLTVSTSVLLDYLDTRARRGEFPVLYTDIKAIPKYGQGNLLYNGYKGTAKDWFIVLVYGPNGAGYVSADNSNQWFSQVRKWLSDRANIVYDVTGANLRIYEYRKNDASGVLLCAVGPPAEGSDLPETFVYAFETTPE